MSLQPSCKWHTPGWHSGFFPKKHQHHTWAPKNAKTKGKVKLPHRQSQKGKQRKLEATILTTESVNDTRPIKDGQPICYRWKSTSESQVFLLPPRHRHMRLLWPRTAPHSGTRTHTMHVPTTGKQAITRHHKHDPPGHPGRSRTGWEPDPTTPHNSTAIMVTTFLPKGVKKN